jgi:hypothetical protein
MRLKKTIVFVLSAGLCLVAASYRWGDSGHAIGLISRQGGKARHPSILKSGKDRYTQIVTATVLPGYRGNARVVLEGSPPMRCEMHLAVPVVDLNLRRKPRFENSTLVDLQPGDRIALWLVMHPAEKAFRPGSGPAPGASGEKAILAFYDTASDQSLLRIPIIFKAMENTDGKVQAR